jgi:hypothetical protein
MFKGIVGTLHHDLACHIIEGWINPTTWTLRNNIGTPDNVCASQSSTENSSVTRFSTQGSSQNSSNMSVDILNPNMLSVPILCLI